MSLTDEQRRALLEELEAEKRRRIEAKIESGKAVLMPPIVVGAPQSESRTKDDLGGRFITDAAQRKALSST